MQTAFQLLFFGTWLIAGIVAAQRQNQGFWKSAGQGFVVAFLGTVAALAGFQLAAPTQNPLIILISILLALLAVFLPGIALKKWVLKKWDWALCLIVGMVAEWLLLTIPIFLMR